MTESTDLLVVGAGLSGLTAASSLSATGRRVVVVEASDGVGGRMATRRIGDATFDSGAQFITVRDPAFAQAIASWCEGGVVVPWFGGRRRVENEERNATEARHLRYRGAPAMAAVPESLGRSLDIRLASRVMGIAVVGTRWSTHIEGGTRITSDSLLLTAPVAQALQLLDAGGTILTSDVRDELAAIRYEKCIAVLAVLEGHSVVPEPGGLAPAGSAIAWIGDNRQKGISEASALTIHATASFSETHWEDDRHRTGQELLAAATPWLGSKIVEFEVHRWCYSRPVHRAGRRFLETRPDAGRSPTGGMGPLLVFAGDAFGGPRVEGAFLSGRAAADYLGSDIGR